MRNLILLTFFCLSQTFSAKGLPTEPQPHSSHVVRSGDEQVKVFTKGYNGEVDISEMKKTSLTNFYGRHRGVPVVIVTDKDSLNFDIPENRFSDVVIKRDDDTQIIFRIHNYPFGGEPEYEPIEYDMVSSDPAATAIFDIDTETAQSKKLRELYQIEKIAGNGTDLEKTRNIASWVHNLWQHDGSNVPEKSDALYILEQVSQGQRYRCVEYGIVTAACLRALGIPSRVLGLKTKDVETRESGAGHVVMEVWIADLDKWVMVDSQFDAIVHLNGVPLNAAEIRKAATDREPLEIWSSKELMADDYLDFAYKHFYYLDTDLDAREITPVGGRHTVDGKARMMLVPLGAPEPQVFQIKYPIGSMYYTSSYKDFYAPPRFLD